MYVLKYDVKHTEILIANQQNICYTVTNLDFFFYSAYSLEREVFRMDSDRIVRRVNQAKQDSKQANMLIQDYMPFIKAETARFLKRSVSESDDELSIAMFAFYEAIKGYSLIKGSFLKFASLKIKNKLIDYYRREKRNQGHISLESPVSDETEGICVADTLQDNKDRYQENEIREATRQEIAHLSEQLAEFGVSFDDIAENAPKQQRTLAVCRKVVSYARNNPEILEEFLRTKKIPLSKLAEGAQAERKTLERHRRYLVAVLLICTNGYEILRGHIVQVLSQSAI